MRNTVLNLLGQGGPVLAAYFAIPRLTRGLGPDRFGILALGWLVLGYFSLFDLGLGRALTQLVSERLDGDEAHQIPGLIRTSLTAMMILGTVGALVAAAVSPLLVEHVLRVPPELRQETLGAFFVLSASIPVVILTAGLRGLLEARHRFDLSNAVRLPLNILMLVAPLFVLPITHDLAWILGLLLAIRVVGLAVHAVLAARLYPGVWRAEPVRGVFLRRLLSSGGWMTVSNVVGPLMVSADRFVIGAVASMSAVAYYTAPYEAVTKLWLFPGALSGVLFPAVAADYRRDPALVARAQRQAALVVVLALFPITIGVIAFAHVGLAAWLGPDYAAHSTRVLQWLAVGVLCNSVAQVPFVVIQGVGRADLTAKLHAAELVPYIVVLAASIKMFGIDGAAIAWTARCAVDAIAMFVISSRLLPRRDAPQLLADASN